MCRFIKYLVIYLYILYTVYMIYSIAEFRKCTREALNKVDDGEEVLIERYGIWYTLTQDIHKTVTEALKSAPVPEVGRFVLTPDGEVHGPTVPKELEPKFCKNGHPIPYPKDRCLGKGCKYS